MFLFLLTSLATLTIHSSLAYSPDGSYGRETRDVVDDVINSLDRPRRTGEDDTGELDSFRALLTRHKTRLEEDLQELKTLLTSLNSPTEHEAKLTEILEAVEDRRPAQVITEDSLMLPPAPPVKKARQPRVITLEPRACEFRLGGHCVTQMMDNAVRQYNYLRSHESPGRRRRRSLRSVLTNQKSTNQ